MDISLPRRLRTADPGMVTISFPSNIMLPSTILPGSAVRSLRGNDISMIFQDPKTSLNPVLKIRTQLTEGIRLHMGLDRKEARDRAVELLNAVGIPDATERINDYPHQFSGGMRQRVMIAMALACDPKLLIADEPT